MRVLRLACALLAAAALLVGCSDEESRPESPTPSASASPTPLPSGTAPSIPSAAGSVGSDGFTVRYLDSDGQVKTLQPKDFPR